MKKRMFSVPYNGAPADEYISATTPYMEHIDSVFFGLPSLLDTHPRYKNEEESEKNTLEFLSKPIPCKRYLTLNKAHYQMSDHDMRMLCSGKVFPLIDEYHIEGVIVTDYNAAKFIHQNRPCVEISTSCNSFLYNIRAMRLWQENCGATIFNPPRDILRSPKLLKEMHDAGFKLKCIVNESCRYGCPQQMTHCFSAGRTAGTFFYECSKMGETGILKCNWVLPRWLKQLDEYVDVYKIAGRGATLERIASMLDAYINERDDIHLDDFLYGAVYRGEHCNLPTNMIPDKLLACGCMDCGKGCNLCSVTVAKWHGKGNP